MKLTEKNQLVMRQFSWERDSELVRLLHEDIVVSSFPPKDMTVEAYRQRLRTSREHGLLAYMDTLKRAYNEGKDGLFIWEIGDEVVGWSWLKVHKNEFFKEGGYGEINEIYVKPEWRRRGIGKKIMTHAHNWFKNKGIRILRVETATSNLAAVALYTQLGYAPIYVCMEKELKKEDSED